MMVFYETLELWTFNITERILIPYVIYAICELKPILDKLEQAALSLSRSRDQDVTSVNVIEAEGSFASRITDKQSSTDLNL